MIRYKKNMALSQRRLYKTLHAADRLKMTQIIPKVSSLMLIKQKLGNNHLQ